MEHHDLLSSSAANIPLPVVPLIAQHTPSSGDGLEAVSASKAKKLRGKRTEYKSITIDKKLEMVKLFKEGGGRNVRSFAIANGVNEQTFYNWVHRYDKGKFTSSPNPKRKRARESNYPQIEAEILKYIENQERNYVGDKSGLSWLVLQTKAAEIANTLLPPEERSAFKASSGWIRNLIRRNNLWIRTPVEPVVDPSSAEGEAASSATSSGVDATSSAAFCASIVGVTEHQLYATGGESVLVPQIVYPAHSTTA